MNHTALPWNPQTTESLLLSNHLKNDKLSHIVKIYNHDFPKINKNIKEHNKHAFTIDSNKLQGAALCGSSVHYMLSKSVSLGCAAPWWTDIYICQTDIIIAHV